MNSIFAITDYQGYFESKGNAIPYNSGMDKRLLEKYFSEFDFQVIFIQFSEVINYSGDFWADKPIIYTSSEDTDLHYKSFIEDIIYYLELCNARVIPSYKYLKANNNKVFMELLNHQLNGCHNNKLKTRVFGSLEEATKANNLFNYPLVFKKSAGGMSRGVGIAKNLEDLIRKLKKISRTPDYFREIWEFGRSLKYKGYKKESKYRNKFIVQDLIDGLNGDYKVLIFGDKYYVLQRYVKKGDFRASGSGIRNFVKDIPEGLLEFARIFIKTLGVPNVSLDIAYNGGSFFLIEFRCLYFGSYTLTHSDFYWYKTEEGVFILREGKSILEEVYASSIVKFCI